MPALIVAFLVGIVCIVLGASNMRGNIESLHSYHRHRVSEEDRLPFGKKVGLGTIIIGVGILCYSVLSAVTMYTEQNIYMIVGTVLFVASLVVGMILCFRAMKQYNQGVF